MQYFKPRSVTKLLLYLYGGISCCTCTMEPREPVQVKALKKDIINCRYTDQMPMGNKDTLAAIPPSKQK